MNAGVVAEIAEIVVVSLVAYRLFRLFGMDSITEGWRTHLRDQWGWYRTMEMVECPWCAGSWWALIVTVVAHLAEWVVTPWPVLWLASAVLVGWLGDHL